MLKAPQARGSTASWFPASPHQLNWRQLPIQNLHISRRKQFSNAPTPHCAIQYHSPIPRPARPKPKTSFLMPSLASNTSNPAAANIAFSLSKPTVAPNQQDHPNSTAKAIIAIFCSIANMSGADCTRSISISPPESWCSMSQPVNKRWPT